MPVLAADTRSVVSAIRRVLLPHQHNGPLMEVGCSAVLLH
jgi:hypothetical protein